MKNFINLLICLLILFTGCIKPEVIPNNPIPTDEKEVSYTNVTYGTDTKQVMDIYLPEGRTTSNTKVLILIHGGGWAGGDKADFKIVIDSLKNRLPGWAIFNLNYRLGALGVNLFPTQENDIKTAIQHIYNRMGEYKISSQWVYAGASAGGHLAMLQGYKNNSLIKPKAVINYFGPADLDALLATTNADLITKLLFNGLFNGTNYASSPIHFINAQTPPTITFQGGKDGLVPPTLQTALHAKLKANGIAEEYNFYENENHGFGEAAMTQSYNSIVAFLKIHAP
ncbi:MAG: prolyl oligopeptidase family serine peptidase [Niabella sp.]